MKTSRTVLTLGYNHRQEVEKGVYENVVDEKVVKAERKKIFQSRRDTALADDMPLNARLETRARIDSNIDYAILDGKKYKVRSVDDDIERHYTVIELGELI